MLNYFKIYASIRLILHFPKMTGKEILNIKPIIEYHLAQWSMGYRTISETTQRCILLQCCRG